MKSVLVVDDVPAMRDQYAYDLGRAGFDTLTAANGREALEVLSREPVDCVILDLEMPVMDGLEALEKMFRDYPEVPVIVYTGTGNYERCVRAIKLGAYNFIDKEEPIERVVREIENALEHRALLLENRVLRQRVDAGTALIGDSPAMQRLRRQISRLAPIPSNVLIVGESGTGKELVARELHRQSHRAKGRFVAINCAAIPENLVESELFGFEKGAFSGAMRLQRGKFEVASGGTLFLDEIGEMPLSVQPKLLRALQEGEIQRLGGERPIRVDVRVVAATNRDLEAEVAAGRFRQDLYYRLDTHTIVVPPLRERLDDLPQLVAHFSDHLCERFGMRRKLIRPETLSMLQQYDWARNNVRELQNIVERMLIACDGDELCPEHVPEEIRGRPGTILPDEGLTFQELKERAERDILLYYLRKNDWHITKTARELGISNHSNLLKMMRRLGIRKDE
jgi:two-component system nitrogen regulation response regulator NtrX